MLKALLFDLDGTLTETDPIHFQAWQDILQEYGQPLDHLLYKAKISGRLNGDIIRDLLPQLSPEQSQELSLRKEAEFRKRAAGQLKPLAGLMDLLDWADAHNLRQAVVTNAPVQNARFTLEVLGLADRFSTVVIAEELERGKPDPLPYQVGLDRLGVSANAALAFEDSASGLRSAIAAGILSIGMTTTHSAEDLQAIGATLAVPNFADQRLAELLKFSLLVPSDISSVPGNKGKVEQLVVRT